MTTNTTRVRKRNANPAYVAPEHGNGRVGMGDSLLFSASAEAALKSANSQVIEDPFSQNYMAVSGELAVIQPPFNINALQNLPRENSMLRQCIEAMVVNTEGHGWRLEYTGPEGQEESPEAVGEKNRLEWFLMNPNPDYSLDETRARLRTDLETTGNAAFEALRTPGTEEIAVMAHVPFATLRMTLKDKDPVAVTQEVMGPDGTVKKITVQRKFRRFVQRSGTSVVYFKEFGDPRTIDARTGQVDEACPEEHRATEIFHMSIYAPGYVYGVPRWINQLPAILGSRQAELTNLDFFRENAIPALAVLVSGGRITQGSLEQIESHVSAARGRKSMNRVLVLEALGDSHAQAEAGTIPPPRVDFKPMAGERQKEGFFLEYGGDCDTKIRSAFRLPPLFVGESQDYTHATAKTAYEVAEGQVFGPARRVTDGVMNDHILATYKPKFWSLRSNPPRITDPDEVIKAINAFIAGGAMSPNTTIDMANEYFDLELPRIEEAWGDIPFEMALQLLVKGQLKGLEDVTKDVPEGQMLDAQGNIIPIPKVQPPKGNIPGQTPIPGKVPGGGAGGSGNAQKLERVAEAFVVLREALMGPDTAINGEVVPGAETEDAPQVVEQHV